MEIVAIIVLVIMIAILVMYNMSIYKKVETFNSIDQQITSLNVLQDFMNTLSEESSSEDKLKKINDVLIQKYNIKYSTIVVYDGTEYKIKASNVAEKHWATLSTLQSEPIFRESIETATPKYVTVESQEERLPYQKMEFARAKSAMFFPLYFDNVYIGYWIIEGSTPHEFDHIDTTILEVVKENIVAILKTVQNQAVIEHIVRDDLFSSLKSAEYLYAEGKKVINKYTTSTVCLFKIINLTEINETVSRKTGDEVITKIAETIREELSPEYLFVRYMGPKFAIIFSGVDSTGVQMFLETIKEKVENLVIESQEDYEGEPVEVSPKINIAITTYYKGTALEELTKKLEEFLDNEDPNESNINYL